MRFVQVSSCGQFVYGPIFDAETVEEATYRANNYHEKQYGITRDQSRRVVEIHGSLGFVTSDSPLGKPKEKPISR